MKPFSQQSPVASRQSRAEDSGLPIADSGLPIADSGLPIADSGLPIADCRLPTVALRRCRQPVPGRVAADASGRPVRVTTDRRGFAGGTVVSASGPWRTSGEWWDMGASKAGAAGGWDRDEWDVTLTDGGSYRVFMDRATGGWFIDAICD